MQANWKPKRNGRSLTMVDTIRRKTTRRQNWRRISKQSEIERRENTNLRILEWMRDVKDESREGTKAFNKSTYHRQSI